MNDGIAGLDGTTSGVVFPLGSYANQKQRFPSRQCACPKPEWKRLPVVAQGYGNWAALLAPRLSPISSRSSSSSTASFS
jgi:hypothetical protein